MPFKKIEDIRQLGAFMFPVGDPAREPPAERSGWPWSDRGGVGRPCGVSQELGAGTGATFVSANDREH
jgi:hypothetical protein